ncbi:MAG: hypothetical protein R2823_02510 [Acidimicrobiia bacterium]
MTDRDIDLILDLQAGRLTPEATEAAMARLETDPALAAEYAHQVAIAEMLASAEPVALSHDERTQLRTGLIDQLHLEPRESATPVSHRRWWIPLTGLAAAAAVVTAVVVLPSSSNDSMTDLAAIETAQTETTGGSPQPPAAADAVPDEDGAAGSAAELYAPGEPIDVVGLEGATTKEILGAIEDQSTADGVTEALSRLGYRDRILVDADALNECIDALGDLAGGDVGELVLVGADKADDTTIVHFGVVTASGIDEVISVDLADCSTVDTTD